MSQPILEVKNLKKYFRSPRGMVHAVDDVSMDIRQGSTMGVVGESGCGKTTLGRVLINFGIYLVMTIITLYARLR